MSDLQPAMLSSLVTQNHLFSTTVMDFLLSGMHSSFVFSGAVPSNHSFIFIERDPTEQNLNEDGDYPSLAIYNRPTKIHVKSYIMR